MAGVKGRSGRQGLGIELRRYNELIDAFFTKYDPEEFQEKLRGGKFSQLDSLIMKGLEGDVKALTAQYNKIMPTKIGLDEETKGAFVKLIESLDEE